MAQRLKSWESPRREGRNDKGRGGSARQRQRRKQLQMLRQKLKEQAKDSTEGTQSKTKKTGKETKGKPTSFPSFLGGYPVCPSNPVLLSVC
jgi:hypothetical protein